jgi:effector-binding domain-containing protein
MTSLIHSFIHWILDFRVPISLVLSCSIAVGLYAGTHVMAAIATPEYTVIQSADHQIEIRTYPELIVAETTTQGDREEAANAAFRILAGYIFGDNQTRGNGKKTSEERSSEKLAMTTPVIQQKRSPEELTSSGEKLAMTTPVIQTSPDNRDARQWRMQFVMPEGSTLETLPVPNHPAITLKQEPAKRVVVIRFSGTSSPKNLSKHLTELQAYMAANNLKTQGEPAYAFYNPPWTLPFMRRNEIMLTVE